MKQTYKPRPQLLLINFLLGVASIYTLVWSQSELAYVSILMFLVSLAPHVLKSQLNLHVPLSFVYVAVVFIFATVGLGEMEEFYDRYHWWDMVMHFGSAIVLGIVGFLILYLFYASKKVNFPKILVVLFGFTFAVTIGTVWEIYEFINDQLFGTNMQVNSLNDTMWDLVVDTIGAFLAAVAGYLYMLKVPVPFMEEIVDEFTTENAAFVEEYQLSGDEILENKPLS